jgi:hypothetical protein
LPEELTERIAKMPPHVGNSKVHRITHAEDHVFWEQQGAASLPGDERLAKNGTDSDGLIALVTR